MTAAAITVDGLTKTFGEHRGIDDLRFEVGHGEVFGFLGPNGAGKSTTIRLLLGLYRPTAGVATVLGRDPTRDAVAIHRQIGYLPGELALHPHLTGRHHVDFAARVRSMKDRTFLDQLVERFGVMLDRPVRTLSKGNRQKIGVVLALMHRPELLVLDEPTSGLDPAGVRQLRETVLQLNRELGMTIFMNTHLLSEVARVCSTIGVLNHGRLIYKDTIAATTSRFPDEASLEDIYTLVASES